MLSYYSRKDIQKQIIKTAKNREVGTQFFPKGFGKRPDILQFCSDIQELAKQGATSFHISEERWKDPMRLKSGLTTRQLDDLRIGWDCIIDIDTDFLDYSKITAELLIEALKHYGIKNYSIKFSGRSGFHIGLPFEAFPEKVHNLPTKELFPEGVRTIASFLKNMIEPLLTERILSLNTLKEIEKSSGIKKTKLIKNNQLDPFSLVDIDSVAISSRHMIRAPYSINEKSSLVSIPIKNIKNFKLSQAKIKNVEAELSFLDSSKIEKPEATQLIIQAFDRKKSIETKGLSSPQNEEEAQNTIRKQQDSIPKIAIKSDFPPCINIILQGLKEDGRKRAVFILINFLRNMGWKTEDIQKELLKWNQKNYEPLREGYVLSQISWSKRNMQNILPPKCDHESYYKTIGCCAPDNWCSKIKNPIQYPKYKIRIINQNKQTKKVRGPKNQ